MPTNDSVSPSLNQQLMEEPPQQSAIEASGPSRFGAFLSSIEGTAVETEALGEASDQQARTFEDDSPLADDSVVSVNTNVDQTRIALVLKLQEATVLNPYSSSSIASSIMNTVFIADIMNKKRMLDQVSGGSRGAIPSHESDMNLNDSFENKEVAGRASESFTNSNLDSKCESESVLAREQLISNVHDENDTSGVTREASLDHHSPSVSSNDFNGGCGVTKRRTITFVIPNASESLSAPHINSMRKGQHHHLSSPQVDECQEDHQQSNKPEKTFELVMPRQALMNATQDCTVTDISRRGQSTDHEIDVELGGAIDGDMGHNFVNFDPLSEPQPHVLAGTVGTTNGSDDIADSSMDIDSANGTAMEPAIGSSASNNTPKLFTNSYNSYAHFSHFSPTKAFKTREEKFASSG